MTPELRRAPSPGGVGRASAVLPGLLVFAMLAITTACAGEADHEPAAVQQIPQQQPSPQQAPSAENAQVEDHASKPSAGEEPPPAKAQNICEALAAAAAVNALPADFFTRLIWLESRFATDAISRKGAQGIAQFMPDTARLNGLENPFDPLQAIDKSGHLLSDLRREFGNLGLAAAAYNAGPARVHDWLSGRRLLPRETRAYVWIITGHSADEWKTGDQAIAAKMSTTEAIRCDALVTASTQRSAAASAPKPEAIRETTKPWGVEIVGGTTPASALARFRDWRPKYEAIVAGREPRVVIRGMLGQAGAARVRIGEDTRSGADKLCASLRSAGTYCDVMRN
jgi:hypothetical protein